MSREAWLAVAIVAFIAAIAVGRLLRPATSPAVGAEEDEWLAEEQAWLAGEGPEPAALSRRRRESDDD